MLNLISFLVCVPTILGAALAPRNTSSYACNNSPDLCSRSYSKITQLGAHDSPFLRNSSSSTISFTDSGNQLLNSTAQLSAGVRLLSAQVHNNNGAWHLCHTSCSLLDAGPLSAWLSEIKSWMDSNPHDVVTVLLVNSDNASADQLNTEFKAANIVPYTYTPPSPTAALTTWPTLQDLITNNTRLITFVASLDPSTNTAAPYLLNEFTFVFENPYNVTSLSNFSCTADRPASVQGQTSQAVQSGRLPLVNHFLDTEAGFGIEIPDYSNITTTNGKTGTGSLGATASDCTTAYGRAPAFFLVDFFDQGSALGVVDGINGIMAVGRTSSTGALQQSSSNAGTRVTTGVIPSLLSSYGWMGMLVGAMVTVEISKGLF